MPVLALQQPGKLVVPLRATAPNGLPESCSGITNHRRASTSSLCRAVSFSMRHLSIWSVSSTGSSSAPPARQQGRPEHSLAARAALALIRAYKLLLSPWFAGACRFVPTCGDYAAEAIARHGFVRGTWLGACRLSKCHPLGASGYDPVPFGPEGPDAQVRHAEPVLPAHDSATTAARPPSPACLS
jgi:uncharacterized protein